MSISPTPEALEAAIRPNTRMIWVETPTNPLLKLVDLERVAAIARSAASGPPPTTPSPAPMCSGRSSSASTSSCIRPPNISTAIPTWSAASRSSATTRSLRERLTFLQNAVGAIQGPFDSFLALRGLKTLALRMERHCASALEDRGVAGTAPEGAARVLSGPCEPSAARARQAADARLRRHDLGRARRHARRARRFLERCQLFALAESLGGVESLIEHPALMTHGSVPPEVRATLGIGDSLVRLSVGIEDADDLIADLERRWAEAGWRMALAGAAGRAGRTGRKMQRNPASVASRARPRHCNERVRTAQKES